MDDPLIYDELRRIARRQRAAGATPTLNTTSLVHEAWLKLNGKRDDAQPQERYLATAATAMRQILVDYARYRYAEKRDVSRQVSLSALSSPHPTDEANPHAVADAAALCTWHSRCAPNCTTRAPTATIRLSPWRDRSYSQTAHSALVRLVGLELPASVMPIASPAAGNEDALAQRYAAEA